MSTIIITHSWSEVGTPASGSQWYTSHSAPNGSVSSPSVSNVSINNNLVPERPPRAEVERDRRQSQRASLLAGSCSAPPSNRDSMGTTDSREDDEEPPPLPQKSSHRSLDIDSENNNDTLLPPRHNYDTVLSPRGSFLYASLSQRRYTTPPAEKPPTPPPKKKNSYN
ncbi:uncharacterized protein LOC113225537 [Hyposmocoma kahamanoa]|uniref:uncharacterized protein LOC113225537 n=1 Tax=Hyposmocoma kahamanoa TaxID=1477025 RepID=UPI000E6D8C0B|nr:uncharacterized protein LOC113225537 [Hyposmocoma kahamanoa]